MVEQQETTRIGLEYLQISANRAFLDELCKRKDEKYNQAMEEFAESSPLACLIKKNPLKNVN